MGRCRAGAAGGWQIVRGSDARGSGEPRRAGARAGGCRVALGSAFGGSAERRRACLHTLRTLLRLAPWTCNGDRRARISNSTSEPGSVPYYPTKKPFGLRTGRRPSPAQCRRSRGRFHDPEYTRNDLAHPTRSSDRIQAGRLHKFARSQRRPPEPVNVSATCPIGRAIAASHGHSRADHPRPRRSQYQQMAAGQRHRVPKLTVQISDVWVADNRYAGGSVGVLPPLPRERQGSATSSPQVGSINVQRCVGAGNLLTFDLSTSRRPARGHGYLAEDAAVRCRE